MTRFKRFKINHIVVLTSFALLVLVALQLYQAFQLYEKKSEDLNNQIENALSKFAIRHEKASDLQRYTSFFEDDFRGQYKKALAQEFQNIYPVQETVTIRDTFIIEDGRKVKYLTIQGESYDSLTDVTVKHNVLAKDFSEMTSYLKGEQDLIIGDSTDLAYQLDQRVMSSMFKKSKYINDFMIASYRGTDMLLPQQRIDLTFLDSIISITFETEKIETNFKYMIVDETREIVKFNTPTSRYDMNLEKDDTWEVRLFPGNIFDEELTLFVHFPARKSMLLQEMWFTLTVSSLLVLLIVVSFYIMFKTIISQKKLAIIKNDFINNMTHEFKTPISTISLACEAMMDSDMTQNDFSSIKPFISMIDEENKRLGGLVEQILKSTVLDRGNVKLKQEELDLNELTEQVVSKARIRVSNGTIRLDQALGRMPFIGDSVHTSNLISNLVDNAIKYSENEIDITVKTTKLSTGDYELSVADKGIGIKNEHLDKIFDKLFRVPTGNVHNVKGYGLGLNYVKTIVDMHKWDINVESKFGEGTQFTVLIKNNKNERR